MGSMTPQSNSDQTKAAVDVFASIADDVGVVRFAGEGDKSFCRRVAYSAARYWVSAFCLDDGANGSRGITKNSLNRKISAWVHCLETFCPGIIDWFDAGGKGIPAVYGRLIDVGDIRSNGFEGTYVATPARLLPVCENSSFMLGFFDASKRDVLPCGANREESVTSGLATLLSCDGGVNITRESWWDTDLELMPWTDGRSLGELEYADPKARHWALNKREVWTSRPLFEKRLGLVRLAGSTYGLNLYVAISNGSRVRLSAIDPEHGRSLYYYLRAAAANPATARFRLLDERHARLKAPLSIVPGRLSRFLSAVAWPVIDANNCFEAIVRTEALPLVKDLLTAAYVNLEEERYG